MKIAITAETTIDLPKEMQKEFDIHVVPFSVLLGEEIGYDGEITPETIFTYVDENKILPKTSAVNEYQFDEFFSGLLKEYDAIIHFSLSSAMSSAYNNALKTSKNYKNVYVIDSRSLSTGIALLAIYASKLVKEGLEPQEIVAKVEKRIPHVQASFVLKAVDYLYKGGRCSALSRFGALLLRIKPQIVVRDGVMQPGKKYFGKMVGCVKSYCADTLEEFTNPDLDVAFVTYSSATPEMIEAAHEALQARGFKHIYHTTASSTISSHCGPNCIGILFINDGGKVD